MITIIVRRPQMKYNGQFKRWAGLQPAARVAAKRNRMFWLPFREPLHDLFLYTSPRRARANRFLKNKKGIPTKNPVPVRNRVLLLWQAVRDDQLRRVACTVPAQELHEIRLAVRIGGLREIQPQLRQAGLVDITAPGREQSRRISPSRRHCAEYAHFG